MIEAPWRVAVLFGTIGYLLSPIDAPAEGACGPTVTVAPGDTYYSISQRCDVSVEKLQKENPEIDAAELAVGQTIQMGERSALAAKGRPELAEAELEIEGILTDEGVACQIMRGYDDRLYALLGDLGQHSGGDLVRIKGNLTSNSSCKLGVSIEIREITEVKRTG